MAAITIDISKAVAGVASIFEKLKDKEYLLRPLAIETIPNMKERIHERGVASDGGQIGTYGTGYLKYRERKGRGKDTKVIVSLTRQLENDWAVIGTQRGYAIGFNNVFNFEKSQWVEQNQDKIIFNLATPEKEYIKERVDELVNNAINGNG